MVYVHPTISGEHTGVVMPARVVSVLLGVSVSCVTKVAMFVTANSDSQAALTLVIALVKETLPVSMKGNGPGLLGTQVKPAGHCATSVTIADSSITVRLGVVGKLKSALGDGPNGSPRCPEWLVMV